MKFQFLCTLFLVLCITLSTSAKPVKRGLLGNTLKGVTNTVKKLLFHGKGTFFDPPSEGGAQGACGPYADKDSQIVAMNGDQYGDMSKKSHWCGKRVKICYKSKCTVATVTDACPTCDHGKGSTLLCICLCTHILNSLNRLFGSYARCLGSTGRKYLYRCPSHLLGRVRW